MAGGSRSAARAEAFATLHGLEKGRPVPTQGKALWPGPFLEGATPLSQGTRFVLRSENATRVELELFGSYAAVAEAERSSRLGVPHQILVMEKQGPLFLADVPGIEAGEVYGYRCWGPNWGYDPAFQPGSMAGFTADVDGFGNRFNPNKLVIDPRARVFTRDPDWTGHTHVSGPEHRGKDSGPFNAKAIVVDDRAGPIPVKKARRMMKDSVIYEVHVKGMTKLFPGVADPGTYKALGDDQVIAYLKDLGVTAVELLPIHEATNDGNDLDPASSKDDNYWGYMTLGFFAPDRRYAADQSADGPVREFKAMVAKLHAAGIEVILDVVFNHSAEGGIWEKQGKDVANVLSMRGVDNATYYELTGGNQFFYDNSGCGGNLRTGYRTTQNFILDSLRYWVEVMGVDGFRFDLASVLGNGMDRDGFSYQKTGGLLDRIAKTFGWTDDDAYQGASRVKLIAEPWAIGDGTYQVGNFPRGFTEWNGKYRDGLRKFLKGEAGAGEMMDRVNGSYDHYGDDGRAAWHGVSFVTAHDGLTLCDLVSFDVNSKGERDALNLRPWPLGPSDGGEEHNNSWASGLPGQTPEQVSRQRRQQARNALALLMLSNGTPMLLGGDERLRTQSGNNNAYNLDNGTSWLEWTFKDREHPLDGVVTPAAELARFHGFARNLIRFRRAFPAFHKHGWWSPDQDGDGDGAPGLVWVGPGGGAPDPASKTFGYRLDGARAELGMGADEYAAYPLKDQDLLVLVSAAPEPVEYKIPAAAAAKAWYRAFDTDAWAEPQGNAWAGAKQEKVEGTYKVNPRSVVVLVQR